MTKFVPSPANSGGKLRSLAIARRLAAISDELVLCCFSDATGDPVALRELGIDVRTVPWRPDLPHVVRGIARTHTGSAGRFWDKDLAALVHDATREKPTDLLQVEYSQLASYLPVGAARRKVLDFHNIESSLALSFARSSKTLKGRLAYAEAPMLRRRERIGAEQADLVSVVSRIDAERMPGRPRELIICPNGWEPTEPLPASDEPLAIFVALMGWKPNIDAALWLGREVWPRVRERMPEARLALVGREPAAEVRALAAPDVEVTGTVPDVRPYLARARVAVAPLLSGGGTRLKVLEALDAGRPIVSTTIGIEGLEDLVGDAALVADEPDAFAERVVEMLSDPDRAAKAGDVGHRLVAERYSWDRVLAPWLERIG
ncbi:MAG TPA: glycosyltransferase family 4 protein [Actinomycetes bacterium]|nr:glycosyltransferase family 4 protein [Actinomycetes bacterium]